jgi:Domain of unknown function (DUF4290)
MAVKSSKAQAVQIHTNTIDHLEYNTQRGTLVISEYGRNVQKMVQMAMRIEDREKRNAAALNIVNVMALLNPQVREIVDYKHKLWDHMIIISDFNLDVDSPYPIPEKSKIRSKPKRLAYPAPFVINTMAK